jgi:ferredoxin--NADP+ reductase
MCGGCRVEVAGETKFACIDGPEFNAHEVDFEMLMRRQRMYDDIESDATRMFKPHSTPLNGGLRRATAVPGEAEHDH